MIGTILALFLGIISIILLLTDYMFLNIFLIPIEIVIWILSFLLNYKMFSLNRNLLAIQIFSLLIIIIPTLRMLILILPWV